MRKVASAWVLSSALVAATACSGESEDEPRNDAPQSLPPVFGGVSEAEVLSDREVRLRWGPALDDTTPRRRIVYRVYQGVGDGPVDTSAPVAVSIPGETSVVVSGLRSGQRFRFVVRAVDAEGNEEANRRAVTVSTGDDGAPVFAGVTGAHALGSRRLLVQWKPAEDEVSPGHMLRYRVYVSRSSNEERAFEQPLLTTTPGVTSVVVEEQPAASELFVGVRAVDESGNEDENTRLVATETPEGNPPEFAGLRSVVAGSTSAELRWFPAIDDATASSEIVYAVYVGTAGGAYNLLAPRVVTDPGVTRWVVDGLEPGTEHFFLVRARDLAGNEDGNVVELAATTEPSDDTSPVFSGVQEAEATTPTSLHVSWAAASDDRTDVARIRYDVYLREGKKAPDTRKEPFLTTLPGRVSADLLGLAPDIEYTVLVRARDEVGNRDENSEVLTRKTPAATDDVAPPLLSGSPELELVPARPDWLSVRLPPATDDTEDASGIRFHVCVEVSDGDCTGSAFIDHVNATSPFGASNVFVTGLSPRTRYRVSVRAEDRSGNLGGTGLTAEGVTSTSFASDVRPLLESRCNQCHGYVYGVLVNVPSGYADPTYGALPLVSPGLPTRSYLYRKLRASGDVGAPFGEAEPALYEGERMPSDKTDPLSSDAQSVLYDWITQGAFEN